jgi:pimeloyl-ACP methyl ester carboxylesterase
MSEADEFDQLESEAREAGLAWRGRPEVRRRSIELADGALLSMIEWGPRGAAEVVALHGGLQNAHSWDRLALAWRRPLLALDLGGHGRSSPVPWALDPRGQGVALAPVLGALAPRARLVAGMSVGGLAAICLAARRPELVRQLCVIDVTPGVVAGSRSPPALLSLMRTESFSSFDEIVDGVAAAVPGRSRVALARSLRHTTRRRPDGRWEWIATGSIPAESRDGSPARAGPRQLYLSVWDELADLRCPLTVVRGGRSAVVTDADIEEVRRRQPGVRVVVIERAGHSVQGSQPAALATLFDELLAEAPAGAGRPDQSDEGSGAASLGGRG